MWIPSNIPYKKQPETKFCRITKEPILSDKLICTNYCRYSCVCTHIMIQVTIVSQTDSGGAILHPWTPTHTPPWEWSSSINPGPRPNRLYPNLCLIACWTQIWSFGCLLKIDFRASYSASLESKSFCRYNKSLPCEAFQSCQCLLAVSFSPYAVPIRYNKLRKNKKT